MVLYLATGNRTTLRDIYLSCDLLQSLLQLLLGPDVGGVAALLLATVGGSRVKPGVALAADHLEVNMKL